MVNGRNEDLPGALENKHAPNAIVYLDIESFYPAAKRNADNNKEGNNTNGTKRGAENLPVQFRALCCAKAPVKAEGDLGLSGPVVAVYESYWPAKSQVIFSVCCNERAVSTMDDKLVKRESTNRWLSSLRQGWGFYAACALISKKECPPKSQKCPTLIIIGTLRIKLGIELQPTTGRFDINLDLEQGVAKKLSYDIEYY